MQYVVPVTKLLTGRQYYQRVGFSIRGAGDLPPVYLGANSVFSPSMLLPAIVAKAEALLRYSLGQDAAAVLGVQRSMSPLAQFGVEADVKPIDGSTEGLLRALFIVQAAEQILEQCPRSRQASLLIYDLNPVISYYQGEGLLAIKGLQADSLTSLPVDGWVLPSNEPHTLYR